MNATKSEKVRYYRPQDKLKFQFHVQGAHIEVYSEHQIQYHLKIFLEKHNLIDKNENISINAKSNKIFNEKIQLEPFSEHEKFYDVITFDDFSNHVMMYNCYQLTEDQTNSIYPAPPCLDELSLEDLMEEEDSKDEKPKNNQSSQKLSIAEWANQKGLRQVEVPLKYLGGEFPEKVLHEPTNQKEDGSFRKIDSGFFSASEDAVGCSQETADLPDDLDVSDASVEEDDFYRHKVRVSQEALQKMKQIQLSQEVPVHPLGKCPICKKHEINGVLLHGKYAHVYACFNCSVCLLQDENCCPVCRLPILSVLKFAY